VLVVTSSMFVPICKRFHARQANSAKITTFREIPILTTTCAGLVKSRRSGLRLLKSTFNAENFICRLPRSISSHFGAFHSWNVRTVWNRKKIINFFYFKGSRSFKVIDVDISRKLVAKACYGKHHVYVKRTNSSKITPFRESAPLSPFLWIPPLPSGMTYFVTKY